MNFVILKKIFLMFIYFWQRERETEHELGRGRERGIHRIRAGSRLWAISTEPDLGLELTDLEIMTWAKVGWLSDWATQVPLICVFLSLMSLTMSSALSLFVLISVSSSFLWQFCVFFCFFLEFYQFMLSLFLLPRHFFLEFLYLCFVIFFIVVVTSLIFLNSYKNI